MDIVVSIAIICIICYFFIMDYYLSQFAPIANQLCWMLLMGSIAVIVWYQVVSPKIFGLKPSTSDVDSDSDSDEDSDRRKSRKDNKKRDGKKDKDDEEKETKKPKANPKAIEKIKTALKDKDHKALNEVIKRIDPNSMVGRFPLVLTIVMKVREANKDNTLKKNKQRDFTTEMKHTIRRIISDRDFDFDLILSHSKKDGFMYYWGSIIDNELLFALLANFPVKATKLCINKIIVKTWRRILELDREDEDEADADCWRLIDLLDRETLYEVVKFVPSNEGKIPSHKQLMIDFITPDSSSPGNDSD